MNGYGTIAKCYNYGVSGGKAKLFFLLIVVGILLVSLSWFIGTKSIYTVTYHYPPKGHPFLEVESGKFIQISEKTVIEKHIGNPFTSKDKNYFMLFSAFNFEDGGTYLFPGGVFSIGNTIKVSGGNYGIRGNLSEER